MSDHVTLLPRSHRWEMGGRSFVALGGAPSVNRLKLTEGIDWWPSEVIQEEHVEATIAGGHAEVMLAHGHYHVAGQAVVRLPDAGQDTTIWSLAANQDSGNVRLLDLETLTDANQIAAIRPIPSPNVGTRRHSRTERLTQPAPVSDIRCDMAAHGPVGQRGRPMPRQERVRRG